MLPTKTRPIGLGDRIKSVTTDERLGHEQLKTIRPETRDVGTEMLFHTAL